MGFEAKTQDKNQKYFELDREDIAKRASNLEAAGKYRTLLNKNKFSRGWQPNWSDKLHTVASVDFNKVRDSAGQVSLTKQVLPVASATEVGPARQIERGGSVEMANRSRAALQTFADGFYFGNGG